MNEDPDGSVFPEPEESSQCVGGMDGWMNDGVKQKRGHEEETKFTIRCFSKRQPPLQHPFFNLAVLSGRRVASIFVKETPCVHGGWWP